MAYILRRKGKKKVSYRAQVRRKGFSVIVKTFASITEAKRWGRQRKRS